MQIIKTGKQVTQAVKNVQRLRTILGVFGRHGLDEFIIRMNLEKYVPFSSNKEAGIEKLTVAERLKSAFESLGPTFVKLGQLLANRPDMFPEEFVEQFKKLQDDVGAVPFDQMKPMIEKELGAKLEEKFASFNETAIASASIGQVYEAVLKDGQQVVVKAQRPDIDRIIKNDIGILTFLAEMMEKYLPETRIISPIQIVEEFFVTLQYELDFVVEANTTQKVAENFKNHPEVVVPKVFRELTTHKILTLQKLNGVKITEVEKVRAMGIDPPKLVEIGARAFFKMLMQDGLFHGDLHGGNLFALKNPETGAPQVGVIDFGIVGRLGPSSRDALASMMLALITEDYETLCYEYADLGAVNSGIDFEAFQREVRNSLAPYMGLSLKEVNAGQVLINSTRIALKYNIRIPRDWMIVFKAIFTLEGIGRQLDENFDFLSIGQDLVKTIAKDRFNKERIFKDLGWVAKDLSTLVQTLPRQIRWMFRKFSDNDFAFEVKIKEIEIIRKQVEASSRGMGLSVVTGCLFIASAILMNSNTRHPLALTFAVLGFLGFFRITFRSWK